jgi:hypothetical protein
VRGESPRGRGGGGAPTATQQRRTWESSGSLEAVVDDLVERTAASVR